MRSFDEREKEEMAFLAKCPKCSVCGEPIQDDYYDFGDGPLCEDCTDDYLRKHLKKWEEI